MGCPRDCDAVARSVIQLSAAGAETHYTKDGNFIDLARMGGRIVSFGQDSMLSAEVLVGPEPDTRAHAASDEAAAAAAASIAAEAAAIVAAATAAPFIAAAAAAATAASAAAQSASAYSRPCQGE
jgi:hypothetical protein